MGLCNSSDASEPAGSASFDRSHAVQPNPAERAAPGSLRRHLAAPRRPTWGTYNYCERGKYTRSLKKKAAYVSKYKDGGQSQHIHVFGNNHRKGNGLDLSSYLPREQAYRFTRDQMIFYEARNEGDVVYSLAGKD